MSKKETSGLYYPVLGSAFTVNDSGNNSFIYSINATGHIKSKKVVATKNKDWKALTGDNQHFYSGDVGNNNGKREFVQVRVLLKHGSGSDSNLTTLGIIYSNNTIKKTSA